MCLDVLRALVREPECAPALLDEIRLARAVTAGSTRGRRSSELGDPADAEPRARRTVERIALAVQASLLVRHAPPFVADAFCTARLGAEHGIGGASVRGAAVRGGRGRVVERAGVELQTLRNPSRDAEGTCHGA